MVQEQHNDVVLVFNLAHDVMLKFWDDGSCTIEAWGQDAAPVRLTRDHQLLLMDALCRHYSFESPIESLVSTHEVGEQQDAPPAPEAEPDPYTTSPPGVSIEFTPLDLPDLPPLPEG